MIRAMALAPQPPETQKKHRAHDKKTGCVPARCGLSLIFRPGSAPPPFPAASRPQTRPASPRRTPKSLRTPDFGKIRPKKISNADFGLYTGERVSNDIDAAFSRRFILPDNLEAAYQASDGAAKLLYFDRQFSDTFSLVHKDAFDESIALGLTDVDSGILDVRLLSALDLATSKISRLAGYDYDDIAALARCCTGSIHVRLFRQQARFG